MDQPKMIVLALIKLGHRYGFEMEQFIDKTNMRLWAKIGMSTIYKALKDLQADGAVRSKKEKGGPGPVRTSYDLTEVGEADLQTYVIDALHSDAPVYSSRIAGLVFAPLLSGGDRLSVLEDAQRGLAQVDQTLLDELVARPDDKIAQITLNYYRKIYQAEREAIKAMWELLSIKS